ncbi:MAG: class I SAM-dependent methyltransferase [Micropepsaceae bacterium]
MSDQYGGETIAAYNKRAWDTLARSGNQWTIPVSPEVIADARQGTLSVVLTPTIPVPAAWLGELKGKRVLGLASAGGQQGPCLAAAGADVTVFDNSPEQLARDRMVAEREGLSIRLVEGDMRDLSCFADASFDLVFHPVSNGFVPNVRPVWLEAFRVLKPGGEMLAGFANPVLYMLDLAKERDGIVQLKYKLPFSSTEQADDPEIIKLREAGEPLDFGHTLDDQLGGQIDAGFHIVGFYEDGWGVERSPLYGLMKSFIATRSRKP